MMQGYLQPHVKKEEAKRLEREGDGVIGGGVVSSLWVGFPMHPPTSLVGHLRTHVGPPLWHSQSGEHYSMTSAFLTGVPVSYNSTDGEVGTGGLISAKLGY